MRERDDREAHAKAAAATADAAATAVVGLARGLSLDHVAAGYDRQGRFDAHAVFRERTHEKPLLAACAVIAGSLARDQVYASYGLPLPPLAPATKQRVDALLSAADAGTDRGALAEEAARYVTALWPQIGRVYRAIAERMRLSGDEVAALMSDAQRRADDAL